MFLIAGIVLLSIIYMLAAQALHVGSELPFEIVSGKVTSEICSLPANASPDAFNAAMNACVNDQRKAALDTLLNRSLLALLGLSVIAFAFGYAMAGRVLSPLGRITRTARRVAGTDLTRRIELDGPDDELKELADTFDDMLDRLERAFTAQQRFVGNASHELRTPLAINRTLLEVHLSDPGPRRSSISSARPSWPPTSAASSWSRACCCWPAATTRSSSANRSTWRRSPSAPSTRPGRRRWPGRSTSAASGNRPRCRATGSCWSGSR
ncbi:HAMP domain-containing protein [Streptomyces sp. Ncost-T6T-2b]|nr:HAMP domain-containing protein [Streptomyces sp. Ncost-T6T-2b]